MDWKFPTSTCEQPSIGVVKQPWSALAVSVTLFLLRDSHASLIAFEFIHLIGHVFMPSGYWLTVMQHASAVWIATSLRGYIDKRWVMAIALDTLILCFFGGIWTLVSGLALGAVATMKSPMLARTYIVIICALCIVVHEYFRCEHMVTHWGVWPYHLAVEMMGLVGLLDIARVMRVSPLRSGSAVVGCSQSRVDKES